MLISSSVTANPSAIPFYFFTTSEDNVGRNGKQVSNHKYADLKNASPNIASDYDKRFAYMVSEIRKNKDLSVSLDHSISILEDNSSVIKKEEKEELVYLFVKYLFDLSYSKSNQSDKIEKFLEYVQSNLCLKAEEISGDEEPVVPLFVDGTKEL